MFHWPNQVTESSSASVWERLQKGLRPGGVGSLGPPVSTTWPENDAII